MKPINAMKQTLVKQGFSQPVNNYEEKLIDISTKVNRVREVREEGGGLLILYGR